MIHDEIDALMRHPTLQQFQFRAQYDVYFIYLSMQVDNIPHNIVTQRYVPTRTDNGLIKYFPVTRTVNFSLSCYLWGRDTFSIGYCTLIFV